jgi:hypothetical protein
MISKAKTKTSKDGFWAILATLNILVLTYPVSLLIHSDDDATRLFAVLVLMVGFLFLAVADTLSIVFAYWGDEPLA